MTFKFKTRAAKAGLASTVSLLCLLPVCVTSSASSELAVPVKFGLEAMTAERRSYLFKQIEIFAAFEAFLKKCNSPSSIERRISAGVEACVRPDALQEVARYFRAKNSENMSANANVNCDSPEVKDLILKIHKIVDDQVNEVTKMCRQCLLCKL